MTSFSTPVCHSQSQTITFAVISATVTAGNALVGTLSFSGSTAARRLRDQEREQGLLRVQAVLGLVPDRRARPVEHVLGDLLAVVGGEAVEDDRVVVREPDALRVDAEPVQVAQPPLALLLLAHARRDVGVEDVGAGCRLARIVSQFDLAAGLACELDG